MAYVITDSDPRSEYAQVQQLDGHQVLAQTLARESGAAGSIREARADTRTEVVASDPIERAKQVVAQQRERDAERARQLGVAWNPDATGIEKAKQVTAVQRASHAQDRSDRESGVDTQPEIPATDPIDRAKQVVAAQRTRNSQLAGELGVEWDPQAAGIEKIKQVTALQRAAREHNRTRDLPGNRNGLER